MADITVTRAFESGTTTGWYTETSGSAVLEVTTSASHSGLYGCHMKVSSTSHKTYPNYDSTFLASYNNFSVVGCTSMSFWMNVLSVSNPAEQNSILRLELFAGNYENTQYLALGDIDPEDYGTWKKYTFNVPVSTDAWDFYIHMQANAPEGSTQLYEVELYIDDFEFKFPEENLDLHTGTWAGWVQDTDNEYTPNITTASSHNGTYGMEVTHSDHPNKWAWYTNYINAKAGETISYWYKLANIYSTVHNTLEIYIDGKNGNTLTIMDATTFTVDNEWHRVSFVVPEDFEMYALVVFSYASRDDSITHGSVADFHVAMEKSITAKYDIKTTKQKNITSYYSIEKDTNTYVFVCTETLMSNEPLTFTITTWNGTGSDEYTSDTVNVDYTIVIPSEHLHGTIKYPNDISILVTKVIRIFTYMHNRIRRIKQ